MITTCVIIHHSICGKCWSLPFIGTTRTRRATILRFLHKSSTEAPGEYLCLYHIQRYAYIIAICTLELLFTNLICLLETIIMAIF